MRSLLGQSDVAGLLASSMPASLTRPLIGGHNGSQASTIVWIKQGGLKLGQHFSRIDALVARGSRGGRRIARRWRELWRRRVEQAGQLAVIVGPLDRMTIRDD